MAQTRVLLITEKFVKGNSELDANISMNLIRPTIYYCQKEYIEKSLGTALYNDLIAKTILDPTLVAYPDYLTLVNDYLADALLKWVMFEVQVPLWVKWRNKSTSTNTSDNSNPVDLKTIQFLEDKYKDKAQYFTQRMEKFLCANDTLYPLWDDCVDGGLDAEPTKPTTSIFLG